MMESSIPQPGSINYRSMGAKLIVICVLALLMTIPAYFVGGLVDERSQGTASTVQQTTAAAAPHIPSYMPMRMVDSYRSVNRSLKYVLLFLGMVFITYFVFEVTTGKRVHPAQYVLVGSAQLIFYLLLLSLAEKIGFDWAFLLSGSATVGLLSTNASWVFASRKEGFRALVVFSLLYMLIYMLLRMDQYALLIGAISSFAAVAAVMYATRGIDWYGSAAGMVGSDQPEPARPFAPRVPLG